MSKTKSALLNLDFSKIMVTTAGEAVGVAGVTAVNRIPFVSKQNQAIRGVIQVAIGKIAVPFVFSLLEQKGKKQNPTVEQFANGVGAGMSAIGLAMIGNQYAPNMFPKISGVDGVYGNEGSPYMAGMGLIADEDQPGGMDGTGEENPYL